MLGPYVRRLFPPGSGSSMRIRIHITGLQSKTSYFTLLLYLGQGGSVHLRVG